MKLKKALNARNYFWNVYCSVTHPRGIHATRKIHKPQSRLLYGYSLRLFSLLEFYSVFKDHFMVPQTAHTCRLRGLFSNQRFHNSETILINKNKAKILKLLQHVLGLTRTSRHRKWSSSWKHLQKRAPEIQQ